MNKDIDFGAAMGPPHEAEVVEEPEETLPALLSSSITFDLSPIALSLVPYEQHVALMVKEARAITVTDQASQLVAVGAEARNKKLWKALEQERKRVLAPIQGYEKSIQNLFKTLQDPLASNEAFIKQERGKYEYQLEMERRRKEAAFREEQRQLQAKLDAEARVQREEAERKTREAAEKLKSEEDEATRVALEKEIAEESAAAQTPTPQAARIVTEKRGVIRTADGSSYTKFRWQCRVVDPDAVPREYCEPAQKLLDAAVKGGVRDIPGCVIEEIAVPVTKV